MKHRNTLRNTEEVNVWLYQNDSLVAMAKTENMTDDGMYIKTNGLLFPKNSSLDIAFTPENSRPKNRLPAKVVHRTLHGIGVKFRKLN